MPLACRVWRPAGHLDRYKEYLLLIYVHLATAFGEPPKPTRGPRVLPDALPRQMIAGAFQNTSASHFGSLLKSKVQQPRSST